MKIAFVLACVTVAVNASLDIYQRMQTPAAPSKPAAAVTFRPGAKAPAVPGVDFSASARTLLLFVSTHCSHCEKSSPFYDKLAKVAAGAARREGKLRTVAVFPQTAEDVDTFKTKMNLKIEAVPGIPLDTVGVTATPTVLLVSQNGLVAQAWVGSEGKRTQDAIYRAFLEGH
jgi:thiol-disulfide isomerase/thioredoxin